MAHLIHTIIPYLLFLCSSCFTVQAQAPSLRSHAPRNYGQHVPVPVHEHGKAHDRKYFNFVTVRIQFNVYHTFNETPTDPERIL